MIVVIPLGDFGGTKKVITVIMVIVIVVIVAIETMIANGTPRWRGSISSAALQALESRKHVFCELKSELGCKRKCDRSVSMENHLNVKCEKHVSKNVSGSVRMKNPANMNCDHNESGSVGSNTNMTGPSLHEMWEK